MLTDPIIFNLLTTKWIITIFDQLRDNFTTLTSKLAIMCINKSNIQLERL